MKAIRTTDTHEWVLGTDDYAKCYTGTVPDLWPKDPDEVIKNDLKIRAEVDTGHPCEWVDVEVTVKSTPTTGMMTAEEWFMQLPNVIKPRGHSEYLYFATDYANYVSEIQAVRFAEWYTGGLESTKTITKTYKKWKENNQ